jgi:hypothetical protein
MMTSFPHIVASGADSILSDAVLPCRFGSGRKLRTENGFVLAGRVAL